VDGVFGGYVLAGPEIAHRPYAGTVCAKSRFAAAMHSAACDPAHACEHATTTAEQADS